MVRRVIPLTLGQERMPKSASVHGDDSGEVLILPVGAALLDTDDGWTLIDTGFNAPATRERRFDGGYAPIVPDGEPLLDALAEHGVRAADIARVYISHLHIDHAGGLAVLPRVPVFIQRAELDFGLGPDAEANAMFREDYDWVEDWRLLDGDAVLAPGVRAVFTPGHTPGHMSFVIDGHMVLAADAADLAENVEREIGPGMFTGDDPEPARQSLLRVKRAAGEAALPLVLWHDPEAWPPA